ncbi:MAG: DNA-directed RNA polymerase subunit beta' [Candidatus Margulisbacteria bacterium]|nr:DNA-directed RNA polymerase subunit beta' [Candidatus Margulisiibacteriota bacterium]MBU1021034.1 DNA-directed RNA polymerase subunit beta' [Candidatus Margulisiibacteriota bacterium]MBU1729709.1 DNA-directed RNA polymerase subunit beta' [Candidatus Margulisiibacteriota bacterium]MBU1955974.1 DNA-directed RNA polymerase subunit beta' [Candidatus Margulisiibacteriota bacterium]
MPLAKQEAPDFDLLQIKLASTERILSWSYGEVEKPETINYRTFKPERTGLFCEKIFGPVKDWECHCGKYRRVRYRGVICERCGVEVTTSRVRRERMGHIRLAVPVAHIWFLRGVPGYMGLLLDISTKSLEEVIYYDSYIVTEVAAGTKTKYKIGSVLKEAEYIDAKDKLGKAIKAETGAKGVRGLLAKIDLHALVSKLRRDFKNSTGQKRLRIIKRLRVAEAFMKSGDRPESVILEVVPVMPPDLRPMVQLEGGRFATSDLNDLYRRVLNRNNRLKKMMNMGAPDMIIRNEKRMLQEAVDVLIDNGRRKRAVTGSTGRALKSLTDIIQGKQGRFRQNLLGKRVDYSGRSVIVVGPNLKIHQCGLPKDMALELFKPFVIRKLVERGIAQNVKSARRQIENRELLVWDILEEVIKGHPVLLNRAPTLHRLGIQAFEPVLVEGKAIQIHPLVCPAFNADFDGDQMAVHVPLLTEAQVESRLLMLASNNVLSPASGRPIITPTQDMVLGTYYMTVFDDREKLGANMVFANDWEAMLANDVGTVNLHAPIKVRRAGKIIETTVGRVKFNHTLNKVIAENVPGEDFGFINQLVDKKGLERLILEVYKKFGALVASTIADEIKRLGFKYATLAGVSISIEDLKVPPAKKNIVAKATKEVAELERHYRDGTLSAKEKLIRSLDVWSGVTEAVTEAMLREFDKLNSVYLMAFSGARGNIQQVRQLAGIRGLMADPSGNIIEIPIKSNFKEGLTVTEYFISSYGARKGLVDTALRTADSGYLTRRLVDVAQDVMITEEDCGTKRGIVLSPVRDGFDEVIPLKTRLIGRTVTKTVADPVSGNVLAKAGTEIDKATADLISEAGIEKVEVRSTLTCKIKRGICQKCYGRDLATGKSVSIGEAVGIVAAQSIGEPGTQLTMRTFHIGGVALHKAAKAAIRTKHAGEILFGEGFESKDTVDDLGNKVKMVTRESIIYVKIKDKKEEHILPIGSTLQVKNKDKVEAGDTFAEYDPTMEYVVASSPGKIKFLGLEVTTKKRKVSGKSLVEHIAKKDGEIFVYNPKTRKEYAVPADKVYVKEGQRVKVEEEIAQGVVSKVSGLVLDISEKGKKGKVVIAPGEFYSIFTGARVMVAEGDTVDGYDLISRVEAIRRDPSKTKDIIQGLPKIEELFEGRRPKDPALLADIEGEVKISEQEGIRLLTLSGAKDQTKEYSVPYETRLKVINGDRVRLGMQLTEGNPNPHDILRILGTRAVQEFLVDEIQKIYKGQGVTINDKHIEVIVRQMTRKVRIVKPGETTLLPGELINVDDVEELNAKSKDEKAEVAEVLLGITKASLSTESFISAASFQETARVLTDAAVRGKTDEMFGLKENVIIGRLIPAGTGFHGYRFLELVPETQEAK